MQKRMQRVVVGGASMAGLWTARVLADHAEEVVVIERDALPAGPTDRKGVPQGHHAHGLLARGQQIAEALFPGLSDELAAAGGQAGDLGEQQWYLRGRRLALPPVTGIRGLTFRRAVLEAAVRERVRALPNVRFRQQTDLLGLVFEGGRVVGARTLRRTDGAAEEILRAALVVDASGRGSRLPRWLAEHGFEAPTEERVKAGVRYSTVVVRRRPHHLDGSTVAVVAAAPPNRHCGVALAIDAERFIVTLPGYLGASAGDRYEDMVEFARSLPSDAIWKLLRDTEPLGEVATAAFPYSQRRHFERVSRHPEGALAIGDSLCSFNPIFGQGMAVAACEAMVLHEELSRGGTADLARRFYRRASAVVDVPWSMAVGNDLRFDEVEGKRTRAGRFLGKYLDRLFAVAAHDPVVGEAFVRVTHLLDPPSALLRPGISWRVLAGPRPRAALPSAAPTEGPRSALSSS